MYFGCEMNAKSSTLAAMIPLGRPVKQLTKLRRKPVEMIAVKERFDGEVFT